VINERFLDILRTIYAAYLASQTPQS